MTGDVRTTSVVFFCGEVHRVCTRRAFSQAGKRMAKGGVSVKFSQKGFKRKDRQEREGAGRGARGRRSFWRRVLRCCSSVNIRVFKTPTQDDCGGTDGQQPECLRLGNGGEFDSVDGEAISEILADTIDREHV